MFPDLHYLCLEEIHNYQPYELAHMHLGDFYGRSPEYMKKLVSKSAKLKPDKSQ